MFILGIETSCDETAAAVVADGCSIRSSVVASQVDVHHEYGGVVPELASRMHLEAISVVVEQALQQGGVEPKQLEGVAVTQGPGLVGALLVGFSFAKAYAYALGKVCVGVDHLQGHLHSVLFDRPPPDFPFVALLASGGHTGIYLVESYNDSRLLGQTRDDAVGEAYDKVAKMLGLGYPGGAVIDKLAAQGDAGRIFFKRPYLDKEKFDFSFSGIKSAVHRFLQNQTRADENQIADIAAGFQEAVLDVLVHKLMHAAEVTGCSRVAVVGGVAANSRLRSRIAAKAAEKGLAVHIPPLALCGDNAAMVAAAGYHALRRGQTLTLGADVYSRAKRAGKPE